MASEDLPVSEIQRRLKAGRELRQKTQEQIYEAIRKPPYELKKEPLRKAEQGLAPLPGSYRTAVADILGLPRRWFTAPLDELFVPASGEQDQLDRLETKIDDLIEAVSAEELGARLAEAIAAAGAGPGRARSGSEGEPPATGSSQAAQ